MNKKTIILSLLGVIVAAIAVAHWYFSDRGRWTTEPQATGLMRSVSGNELVSTADPGVVMRFDPAFRYIGGQQFVLYGVADTEQHFFVETTPQNKMKTLYWLQFEAYLPDNSYSYNYESSPGRLDLDGVDFYLDTEAVHSDPNRKRRRGTDGAMVRQFVQSKGYSYPDDFLYARLVHLTDASRRKELMVIVIEDLAPMGLTADDLQEGGKAEARWPAVEKEFIDRIHRTMRLRPMP